MVKESPTEKWVLVLYTHPHLISLPANPPISLLCPTRELFNLTPKTGGQKYTRSRVGPRFEKIHYSEPNSASDCHFPDPVFRFLRKGVHR